VIFTLVLGLQELCRSADDLAKAKTVLEHSLIARVFWIRKSKSSLDAQLLEKESIRFRVCFNAWVYNILTLLIYLDDGRKARPKGPDSMQVAISLSVTRKVGRRIHLPAEVIAGNIIPGIRAQQQRFHFIESWARDRVKDLDHKIDLLGRCDWARVHFTSQKRRITYTHHAS
jgi:hypothetical protein